MSASRLCLIAAACVALGALPPGSAAAAGAPSFEAAPSGLQVPVSALARPAAWLDPSRLRVSTLLSVGTGFSGHASALQVTSFGYQFQAPLRMSVSLGNTFGLGGANGGGSFFLEGLDLAWHPLPSMLFEVRYQDLRSPLQLAPGPWGTREPLWR